MSFGVLAVAAGASVLQACAMSALTFTGASQFSFVSVIGAGGSVAGALPPALVLGARNGVYAVSLKQILRGGRARHALDAHLVIDESTALSHAQADPAQRRRAFHAAALSVFVCWNAGTLLGAVLGTGLGDPRDYGLDAIFPAVFLALLVPQLRRRGAPAAAVTGAVLGVVLLPLTAPGVPVMAAALAAIPFLALARRG